jgi:hypothetical protein
MNEIVCLLWHSYENPPRGDSAIGVATGYGLDDRGAGVRVPAWLRIFSSPRLT